MADESLLAHLADRFVAQRENLATEALAYLLGKQVIATEFRRHLTRFCGDLGELTSFATQQSTDGDNGIPDIVGFGPEGPAGLLVEAKFAAALTGHQPVSYMRHLADTGRPGLLLFLVPIRRAEAVWNQVLQRCHDAEVDLDVADHARRVGLWRNVTVAVTTWSHLLDDLAAGLNVTDHRSELSEIAQLRGLCDREDQESFAPLTEAELGGTIGQRMLDLNALLNEAVEVLRSEGKADLRGLRWSSGEGWFGRYFKIRGLISLLHVSFRNWGRDRATPLWLRVYANESGVLEALGPLSARNPSRLIATSSGPQIPIGLPAGVDRDTVLGSVLDQLREIYDLLPEVESHDDSNPIESDHVEDSGQPYES